MLIYISMDEINYVNELIQYNHNNNVENTFNGFNYDDFALLWGKLKINTKDNAFTSHQVKFTPLVQINPHSQIGYRILQCNLSNTISIHF